MIRPLYAVVILAIGLTGCAGTWDKISSRRFRENPIGAMYDRRDPLDVMRTSLEGDDRAAAMRKLKEPASHGRGEAEQEEAMRLLTEAAINDSSPVVRVAAIDALGRFRDPRAVRSLTAAYYRAGGTPADPANPIQPASTGRSLSGPVGFAPEIASVVRGRAIESLAQSGSPEAVSVLAQVATGAEKSGGSDRDTRLAAVRGLKTMRSQDSVAALAKVLAMEKSRDPAMADRAHEGLVALTGRNLPDDPQQWDLAVRNGQAPVVAEPNFVQQAAFWAFGN
jgi:HEAT repeat protein